RSGTVALSGDTFTGDVTGTLDASGATALTIGANTVALTTDTTGNYVASATASGGLTLTGTEGGSLGVLLPAATDALSATTSSGSGLELVSAGLTLLQGCAANEILKWNETSDIWACAADADSGGSTAWHAIGDATTAGEVLMGETAQDLTWNMATDVALNALEINMTHDFSDTTTQRILVVANVSDAASVGTLETMMQIDNRDSNETVTNGLLIEQTGAGTMTNAIQIAETAGTITDGILITGTLGNILNSASIDITGAGAITGATGVTTTTLSSTGVTTIGDNSATVAINSSDWDISTTGAMTGIGAITSDGAFDTSSTIQAGSSNVTLTLATGFIDADALTLTTAADGGTGTSSGSGLIARSDGIGLLQGCTDGQILKWVEATDTWDCAADDTGGGGAPDTATFTDTTSVAWADNNTTELFNDATRPNITTDSTAATVLVAVHIRGIASNTANDAFLAARIVRETDGTNPTSGDTQVGYPMIGGFTTAATHPWMVAGTFLDSPGVAGGIRYTIFTSAESVGTTTDTPDNVTVTLVELGADLAENYYTTDGSIEPGDIVAIDPSRPAGIQKTRRQYDPQLLGIVSTAPALTLNDATRFGYEKPVVDGGAREIPVALSGRVPVKVSTENGRVRAGDLLTPSSLPGVAMKATKAGAIIGQALSDFNYPDGTIGLVATFVKTTYGQGVKLADILPGLGEAEPRPSVDAGKLALAQFISQKEQLTASVDLSEIATDRVAAGLEVITPKVLAGEVATDRLTTATGADLTLQLGPGGKFILQSVVPASEDGSIPETKTPAITFDSSGNASFAGEVKASAIHAEKISGLEVFTDKIAALSTDLETLSGTSDQWVRVETLASLQSLFTVVAEEQNKTTLRLDALDQVLAGLDQRIAALETSVKTLETAGTDLKGLVDAQGKTLEELTGRVAVLAALDLTHLEGVKSLRVAGSSIFAGGLQVDTIISLSEMITMVSDVAFFGRPYFNADTGGFAVVKQGAKEVRVEFVQEYLEQPVINVTITLDDTRIDTNINTNEHEELVRFVFENDIRYVVTRKSTKGFTILLNKAAAEDIQFSWIALAVKGAKTFDGVAPTVEPVTAPEPAATTEFVAEPVLSPEPVVEEIPETQPESEPQPVAEFIAEPEPVAEPVVEEPIEATQEQPALEPVLEETTAEPVEAPVEDVVVEEAADQPAPEAAPQEAVEEQTEFVQEEAAPESETVVSTE
ncbi:hypothetical protein HYW17_05955, partial [Candidatus Uhrbacteria bacterium]|nr:hypothetical protein [Candidatus Uhrbacteria bacterium]